VTGRSSRLVIGNPSAVAATVCEIFVIRRPMGEWERVIKLLEDFCHVIVDHLYTIPVVVLSAAKFFTRGAEIEF